MRNDIFIETENVTEFDAKVHSLSGPDGEPGIAVVHGQAGRGKTVTTRRHYAQNGGVFVRVMQDWTQAAFLRGLCAQICREEPRTVDTCRRKIHQALRGAPRTIFVDEADRLKQGRIEDLRDIHDETGSSVVLVGEEELLGLLDERRRIWSRVKQVVTFEPVSTEDVAVFGDEACGLQVEPDACNQIVTKAGGDFRLVKTLLGHLEKAARTRGTDVVTVSMVADVSKAALGWRRV